MSVLGFRIKLTARDLKDPMYQCIEQLCPGIALLVFLVGWYHAGISCTSMQSLDISRRKMKHLDWYMTMKKTSDKRNAKYYAACLEGAACPGLE